MLFSSPYLALAGVALWALPAIVFYALLWSTARLRPPARHALAALLCAAWPLVLVALLAAAGFVLIVATNSLKLRRQP